MAVAKPKELLKMSPDNLLLNRLISLSAEKVVVSQRTKV